MAEEKKQKNYEESDAQFRGIFWSGIGLFAVIGFSFLLIIGLFNLLENWHGKSTTPVSPLAGDERKPSFLQVLIGDVDRFILLPHLRKPTSYTVWQKEPWDVGGAGYDGSGEATGLDFILVYWMGKFHGFLP